MGVLGFEMIAKNSAKSDKATIKQLIKQLMKMTLLWGFCGYIKKIEQ